MNNNLNGNGLHGIIITKSSKKDTWPERDFLVSFYKDYCLYKAGSQLEIIRGSHN